MLQDAPESAQTVGCVHSYSPLFGCYRLTYSPQPLCHAKPTFGGTLTSEASSFQTVDTTTLFSSSHFVPLLSILLFFPPSCLLVLMPSSLFPLLLLRCSMFCLSVIMVLHLRYRAKMVASRPSNPPSFIVHPRALYAHCRSGSISTSSHGHLRLSTPFLAFPHPTLQQLSTYFYMFEGDQALTSDQRPRSP